MWSKINFGTNKNTTNNQTGIPVTESRIKQGIPDAESQACQQNQQGAWES